jgi:Zn-dependent protease with chaperone function
MDKDLLIQHAVQSSTVAVKWSGTSAAVWWGIFSFNEWLAIASLLVAIVGSIINSRVNYYYRQKEYGLKLKEDQRAQERHDALTAGWTQ